MYHINTLLGFVCPGSNIWNILVDVVLFCLVAGKEAIVKSVHMTDRVLLPAQKMFGSVPPPATHRLGPLLSSPAAFERGMDDNSRRRR
jgi:hypothetical protein